MSPNVKHDAIAFVALGIVDLRAQYDAELRTLNRAEAALLKCRDAAPDGYAACVEHFRNEMRPLSETHENVSDILGRLADDVRRLDVEPQAT